MKRKKVVQNSCLVIAKFHYMGPTGPDQTKSADLSETRVCGPGLAKKSVLVHAGPVWPV